MAQILTTTSAGFYAVLSGFVVSFLWLWFWLKEDPHPEPRRVIIRTFIAGIIAVPIALFFEEMIYSAGTSFGFWKTAGVPFLLLFLWAGVEEILKYLAAYWTALRTANFDEPIDAPIYLITASLGFAALENVFLLSPIFYDTFASGFVTANLRFVGATLLHIFASSIVGMSIAYSFFHPEHRYKNVLGGLFFAILLHTLFNFFILKGGESSLIFVFSAVWIAVIVLILSFEKIKQIKR